MSSIDPSTVLTAIGTLGTVSLIGGGARSYLKKARRAEIAEAVEKAVKAERLEARVRELESRFPDDDA